MKPWRSLDVSHVSNESVPPLVIETYLDLRQLTSQQIPILVDKGKSCNATKGARKNEIVLERWIVELVPSSYTNEQGPDIPIIYKQAILILRSLYTYTRMMPCWTLRRKLVQSKLNISPLSIGCRVLNGNDRISSRGRIGLTKNITEAGNPHLDSFAFHDIETPIGLIRLTVSYRTNCDFRISDSEALLSTHFLDLDGRKNSYGHMDSTGRSSNSTEPESYPYNTRGDSVLSGSMNNPAEPPISAYRPSSLRSGSSEGTSLTQQTLNQRRNSARSPDSPRPVGLRAKSPQHTVGTSTAFTTTGKPSVSFIQPFKSPSLAESPNEVSSLPRVASFSRNASNSSLAALRIPISQASQSPGKSSAVGSFAENAISSSSSSSVRGDSPVRRYSSSFSQRNQWKRAGSMSSSKSRASSFLGEPSSVGSNSSIPLEPGSGLYIPSQDLGDFVKMVDSTAGLFDPGRRRSLSSSGETGNSREPSTSLSIESFGDREISREKSANSSNGSALSRFQQLKSTHAALTESLQSSVYVPRPESTSPYTRGSYSGGVGSYGATSASAHTPVIPSRLSEAVSIDGDYVEHSGRSKGIDIEPKMSGGSNGSDPISSSARVDPVDIAFTQHRLGSAYRSRRKSSSVSGHRISDETYDSAEQIVSTAPAAPRTARNVRSSNVRNRSRSRLSISGRNRYQDDDLPHEEDDDDLLFAMSDMHLVKEFGGEMPTLEDPSYI